MKMRHVTTLSDFNMAISETALPTAQVLLKEIHNSEARLLGKNSCAGNYLSLFGFNGILKVV